MKAVDAATPRRFKVAEAEGTTRLDQFLTAQLPELSRARVQQLVRAGHATIDGRVVQRPATRVGVGSEVGLLVPASEAAEAGLKPAPRIEFGLIHEDASILVVDKPAGLVVHPAVGHLDDTLVHAIRARYPDVAQAFAGSETAQRPGIVHRLDRDTSGAMVVARNPTAAASLMAQFKARSVHKTYVAIARGDVQPPAGLIDAPVGRDPLHRQRMRAVAGGREARTAFRVIEAVEGYSLLELKPETGRTHQIRVHLKAVGHPVVGDPVYGRTDPHIDRLALHAWRLAFAHPADGRAASFTSPLPSDMERALAEMGFLQRPG